LDTVGIAPTSLVTTKIFANETLFILQNGGLAFWLDHLLERVHSGLKTKVYAQSAYFFHKKKKNKKHLIKKKAYERKSGPLK